MKCYECEKGDLVRKKVEYTKYGILIGKYPADVCTKCGEVFFDSKAVGEIERKVNMMGLWGLRIGTVPFSNPTATVSPSPSERSLVD